MKRGLGVLAAGPYLWPPALVLLALPLILIPLSLRDPWYANHAGTVWDGLRRWAGWLSLAAAALAAVPRLGGPAWEHLDRLSSLPAGRRRIWLAAAAAGVLALFLFLKFCQYRGYQLPQDTAMTASMASYFLRHGALYSSVYGVNYFAVHFQPLIALYAPLLLLGNSVFLLVAAQTAVVASMPFAVSTLVRRRCGSTAAAFAGLWLAFTSPFAFEILANNLEASVCLAGLFLWGMVLAEARRPVAAGVLFVLAAAASEQAPLAFFGLGLYVVLRAPGDARSRRLGAAVCAAAAALFAAEMGLTYSFPREERLKDWANTFGNLGPTPGAALSAALGNPLSFLAKVAWPPEKLAALGRILSTTGLFCLASPAAAAVWLVNFAPNFLAPPGGHMHEAVLHYAAQVMGPVWWAMAAGLAAIHGRLAARGRAYWLLPWCLLVGGLNIRRAPGILFPGWYEGYFHDAPAVLARIPRNGGLWIPQWLSAPLGARPHIKLLPYGAEPSFLRRLFVPDHVLLTKHWILGADPGFRKRVAGFLRAEGYRKLLEDPHFVLLEHPRAPLAPEGGEPPPAALPEPKDGLDFTIKISPELLRQLREKDAEAQRRLSWR